jgi:hypothetical protein
MAGLDPAIHVFLAKPLYSKDVNARDKPGHDEFWPQSAIADRTKKQDPKGPVLSSSDGARPQ